MKLQKNIFRIQNLISENRIENKIVNLINRFGFEHVYRAMGYEILDFVPKDEKIKFIKGQVEEISNEFGGSGISVHEMYREPIFFGETEDELRQIEYFARNSVYVDVYDLLTDSHLGDFTVMYEALNDDILNEVFLFFVYEYK